MTVSIIKGGKDSGKTTWCRENLLSPSLDGVLQLKVFEGGRFTGYDAWRVSTADKTPLLRLVKLNSGDWSGRIGRFYTSQEGMHTVRGWLTEALDDPTRNLIIDEVGRWELEGEGYFQEVRRCIRSDRQRLLHLVMRDIYLDALCSLFGISEAEVIEIEGGELFRRYPLTVT